MLRSCMQTRTFDPTLSLRAALTRDRCDSAGVSEMGWAMSVRYGYDAANGEPEEMPAGFVLASDEASLINGAVVTADAGWGAY